MEVHLLKAELKELQTRYRDVLVKAKDNIFSTDSIAVIDEINVFWQQNKKLVEFSLRNFVLPYDAYVFTAATILDVEDFEHYPFVSLGKFHIWDDPIYKYANIVGKTSNLYFNEKMKEQVIDTILDNLKILDMAEEIIYILPLRYLSSDISQLAFKAGMQAFLSLFDKEYSFEEYKKTFCSIEDIKNSLRAGIEQSIIFTEDEDTSVGLETRFARYKDTTTLPLSKDACDAEIFWFAIFSYLSQAFDIILMCTEYQLNPYIRFDIAFKYMIILSANFKDQREIQNMIFKGAVAHILHRKFNKEKVKSLDFKRYYDIIQESNFDTRLFSQLEQQGVTINNPNLNLISNTIDDLLKMLF